MNSTHSQKIILWGGLAFVCGVAWTLGAAIPATITLAAMLGIVIVIILIVAYAILIIAGQPGTRRQTRYVEREVYVERIVEQPRTEPKLLQAQPTRYSVVETPQAKLPQAQSTIGTSARQQIEVNR